MKKSYPRLEEVMRRADILGTPPLTEKIRDKLVSAFTDICYRRDIDLLKDEFVYECIRLITNYSILCGDKTGEKQ